MRARGGIPMLLACVLFVGCGGSDSPTEPQGGTVEVSVDAERFRPAEVLILPGTTVRWVNAQSIQHTVTPDGHVEWERTVLSGAGEVFEHTFDETGTFPYFCEPHRSLGMTGTVRVVDP